jgi:hypothetical protein
MIRIKNRSVSIFALLSILLASSAAMAIGPQYQVIGDPVAAGAGPLNDVVSLVDANGIEQGTGSLIGIDARPGGLTFMSILTARHVALGPSAIKTARFGVGPGEAGAPGAGAYPLVANYNNNFVGFTLVDAVNNPNNRVEDLAILQVAVKVPAGGAALAEYNKVVSPANIFLLSPFPTAPPAPNSSAASTAKFTELGYGTAGTYDTANNRYIPSGVNNDDARRFQNNNADKVDGPALMTYGGIQYYQPLVNWAYKAASAAGGGASFPGDSGGPYLTGGVLAPLNANSVSVTPSYTDNTNANNPLPPNVATNIPLSYTDYLSAVHVSGVSAPGTGIETVGGAASGVPLTETGNRNTGTLDWAMFYGANPLLIVPEPGSILLVIIANCYLVLFVRRRR